jgi:hypothetical protein
MAVYGPASTTGAGYGSLAVRVVLTLVGAVGMIGSAFVSWIRGIQGTEIPAAALFDVEVEPTDRFVASLGFVMIVLGLLAIIGLAPRSGWLTRLAGALGIAAFVLVAIQLYRAPGDLGLDDVRLGGWIALVGSVIALVGGFFGTRTVVVSSPPAATTVVEP